MGHFVIALQNLDKLCETYSLTTRPAYTHNQNNKQTQKTLTKQANKQAHTDKQSMKPTKQSINQPVNQSIKQSINEAFHIACQRAQSYVKRPKHKTNSTNQSANKLIN